MRNLRHVDPDRLLLIAGAIVAAIATVGSLYFSLGMGLYPCELCWYQRILMYPLVLVLGIAALDDRHEIYRTALPFAVGGMGLAAYHSYLQVTATEVCSTYCATVQFQFLGVLTIPNLSLIAFTMLVGLLSILTVHHRS